MTKPEVLQVLFSLAAGNYIMQGKEVAVTPIRIANLRRGKFYHINDGESNYVEFKIMHQRDGIYIEDLVIKGDIKDLEDFIGSLLPEPSTFERRRESLEILLLILTLLAILTTPITIVGFIMDQSWAWGTLFFLLAMVGNALWLWRKLK